MSHERKTPESPYRGPVAKRRIPHLTRGARRGAALALGTAMLLTASACSLGSEPTASGSASPPRALTISAPSDCLVNAYCGRGLATTYGIDVADHLVTSDLVDESVAALKDGEVDVAVVFSHSPAAADPDLVVLDDDRGMLASERVTPVFRRSVTELFGTDLAKDLDALSALITPDALSDLDAAVTDGQEPSAVANAWLSANAPAPSAATPRKGRPLTVASVDFLESRVLGEVISGFLQQRGYPTKVLELTGGRAALVDSLANGDVDIAPEYSASLLEYLNGFAGEATTDADATSKRLAEYLDLMGVAAATPATATSTNVFVTTKEIAAQRGLDALSDLAGAGVPEAATDSERPDPDLSAEPALGINVRAVGHQLASGSTGPEVRDLQERLEILGFDVPVSGTYDAATVDAVRGFQATQGLATDGVAGPRTAAALADPADAVADPQPVRPGDGGAVAPPKTPTKGGSEAKVLYLTFDDGPSVTYTKQILDLLDKYDAKATFFELGQNASAHPDLTREVVRRGHAVANHTWDHADMSRLSSTALDHEITTTSATLEKLTGKKVTCLRPPYGALNKSARAAIERNGLDLHLWDIDPQDWNRPGVSAIVDDVVSNARSGRVSLMHDGGGNRSQTVSALAEVLPNLSAKGYRFETLPGC